MSLLMFCLCVLLFLLLNFHFHVIIFLQIAKSFATNGCCHPCWYMKMYVVIIWFLPFRLLTRVSIYQNKFSEEKTLFSLEWIYIKFKSLCCNKHSLKNYRLANISICREALILKLSVQDKWLFKNTMKLN